MKLSVRSTWIVFIFCCYCALVFNVGLWHSVWLQTLSSKGRDWLIVLTMPIFIVAAMNIIMQLFFWPLLHRVWLPLLLLLGAGASYAVMVQGVYFNSDMIQNLLQTNPAEASDWLSIKFIAWIFFTGVLPAIAYLKWIKVQYLSPWYREIGLRLVSVCASLLVIASIAAVGYSHYAPFFRNHKAINHQVVPTNFMSALLKTAYNAYDASRPFETIGLDAKVEGQGVPQKQVLVLVVGETTRAKNWGLNAGAPNTTPQLAAMSDVINFQHVSSCGTATAISVPCMFSDMNRSNYNGNLAKHREGLMDVLQRAGVYTSWRENDSGCKGACDRIKHIDVKDLVGVKGCTEEGCYDTALLSGLAEEIQAMPKSGVIVLHTIGSHGPTYYHRYPSSLRRFTPTCDTNEIQDCEDTALLNTYNNTVLAVDDMLAKTINILKHAELPAAMLYVSDHGESLGENGMYLHAAPYAVAPAEQTHVPMIFWANPSWYSSQKVSRECLKHNAMNQSFSHDNWFDSVLGVMHIQTSLYRPQQDLFAACR